MASPPGLGQLIYGLPPDVRKLVRRLEKCGLKLVREMCCVKYNEVCLRENILPKYSNIKLHDSTLRNEPFTLEFRRRLIQRELDNAKKKIDNLETEEKQLKSTINGVVSPDIIPSILQTIESNNAKHGIQCRENMMKKLSRLSGHEIFLPEECNRYINLSKYKLSKSEETLLNMGLNCHVMNPVDKYRKKVELEILYDDILKLQSDGIIEVKSDLRDQLRAEGTKVRGKKKSSVLTAEIKQAAKSLRENEEVVIRRADKSSIFVVLDRDEYRRM